MGGTGPTPFPAPIQAPKVGFFEKKKRKKLLDKYNEEQSDLMVVYEKDHQLITGDTEPIENERRVDRILSRISFVLNITLLFGNLAAAILSNSLSIVSTFVDSAMDLTTSTIIWISLHLIKNADGFKYPRGRERLETVSVTLCAVIMGMANMVIILQSVEAIISDSIHPEMNLPTLIILLAGIGTKIVLMIICYKVGTDSTKVLAMDMRNDIATSVVAITCAIIGDKVWKYADPIGACGVCGIIAISWFSHALEHIPSLTGVRTDQQNLSRILKIVIDHDERIEKVDHVTIYHTGAKAIVEIHIVMSENLPLKVTHDISHPLEKKINLLDFVSRTYVHCDYFCDGD